MEMDRASVEKLVELATNLNHLTTKVDLIDGKLDEMRTDHAQATATKLSVQDTKIERLEKIVYGTGTLCIVEGIAILIQYLSRQS